MNVRTKCFNSNIELVSILNVFIRNCSRWNHLSRLRNSKLIFASSCKKIFRAQHFLLLLTLNLQWKNFSIRDVSKFNCDTKFAACFEMAKSVSNSHWIFHNFPLVCQHFFRSQFHFFRFYCLLLARSHSAVCGPGWRSGINRCGRKITSSFVCASNIYHKLEFAFFPPFFFLPFSLHLSWLQYLTFFSVYITSTF